MNMTAFHCRHPLALERRHRAAWTLAAMSVILLAVGHVCVLAGVEADTPQPPMTLTSPAFEDGQPIPIRYTGEGEDLSPPLRWANLPAGTVQLALIMDDPDAPTPQPWVHWVIYCLPPETQIADATQEMPQPLSGLPEGIPRDLRLDSPPGALQGVNSWPMDNVGYRGPMPPPDHGEHRYHFRLYALDAALDVEPGLSKDALLAAMEGRVLATAVLTGTYTR
jgi:Raf kinase inhibitor-like YbhB/YbcL family protein